MYEGRNIDGMETRIEGETLEERCQRVQGEA